MVKRSGTDRWSISTIASQLSYFIKREITRCVYEYKTIHFYLLSNFFCQSDKFGTVFVLYMV